MSFPFFGRKKTPVIKQAAAALEMTAKVINYRRDVLAPQAVAELEETRARLRDLLQQMHAATKAKKTEGEGGAQSVSAALEAQLRHTSALLQRHGGKIYPHTFAAENIEMLVVAAILAIGIRSFFFQPFKIPTNSMWPTYAGMIPVVYEPSAPRPDLAQRTLNKILYWSQNHYITTPVAGEVVIPVLLTSSAEGASAQLLRSSGTSQQLFGLREVPESRYQVYVGNTNLNVSVPQDFPLEPVILKSYFPEYDSLYAALEDYRRQGKVATDGIAGSNVPVYVIRTGVHLNAGDAVLDFDIKTGDMLFVDRFSYNFVRPQVGDPIVFRTDNIPGLRTIKEGTGGLRAEDFLPDERYYIKRLVGIGGDTLEVQGSTLYRNGEPITGAEAFRLNAERSGQYPGYQPRFALAPGKTDVIKDGFFYAMGDNSPESHDSRSWSYEFGRQFDKRTATERSEGVPQNQVPERDVVGKAVFIFYPLEPRWGLAK